MGLADMVIGESAAEDGDGATCVAFLLRGRLGLVCTSVGDAGLFLGPLAGVDTGVASNTTTGGSDEGPGVGSRAFFFALPLVVVVVGAPGSVCGQGLTEGSKRAWRSGSPTTGVCFASNLM